MTHRIALLAAALGLMVAAAGAAATAGSTRTTVATIATAAGSDFRADLVAQRASGGVAPTATVTLTTFRRSGAAWRTLASRRVAGTFFWKTISGPRVICRFELASAAHPHVTVQLLLTPSLGCGKPTTVPLPAR